MKGFVWLCEVKKRLGRMPWNISFSWSWALQAPLLDLCKGKGGKIPLKEMSGSAAEMAVPWGLRWRKGLKTQ